MHLHAENLTRRPRASVVRLFPEMQARHNLTLQSSNRIPGFAGNVWHSHTSHMPEIWPCSFLNLFCMAYYKFYNFYRTRQPQQSKRPCILNHWSPTQHAIHRLVCSPVSHYCHPSCCTFLTSPAPLIHPTPRCVKSMSYGACSSNTGVGLWPSMPSTIQVFHISLSLCLSPTSHATRVSTHLPSSMLNLLVTQVRK